MTNIICILDSNRVFKADEESFYENTGIGNEATTVGIGEYLKFQTWSLSCIFNALFQARSQIAAVLQCSTCISDAALNALLGTPHLAMFLHAVK